MAESSGRAFLPFLTGLALALAFVPGIPEAAIIGRWSVLAVLASIMLFSAKPGWPAMVFLAFVGWVFLSLVWAPYPTEGLGYAVQWFILWMCFAAAPEPRPLLRGAAVGLTVSAVIAGGQAFGFEFPGYGNSGLFVNHNTLAESSVVVLVGMFVYGDWLLVLPAAVALGFSYSRGSVVALGVSLVFQLDRKIGFGLLAAITLGLVLLYFHPDESIRQRFEFWTVAWEGLTWVGQGIGAYSFNFQFARNAHNDYLQMAYELGIGGIGFAVVLALAFSRCRQDPGAASALLAVCVLAMFAFPFQLAFTGGMAAFMAGRLCGFLGPVRLDWREWASVLAEAHHHCRRSADRGLSDGSGLEVGSVRSRNAALAAHTEG